VQERQLQCLPVFGFLQISQFLFWRCVA